MTAAITVRGKRYETETGITLNDAVASHGMLPNAFLYLKNGVPVPSDTVLEDGMEIEAIKIASGG